MDMKPETSRSHGYTESAVGAQPHSRSKVRSTAIDLVRRRKSASRPVEQLAATSERLMSPGPRDLLRAPPPTVPATSPRACPFSKNAPASQLPSPNSRLSANFAPFQFLRWLRVVLSSRILADLTAGPAMHIMEPAHVAGHPQANFQHGQ